MVLVFYTRCFTVHFKNYVLYVDIDRCDWNVIFIGSSSHFEADLLISRRFFRSTKRLAHQREGIRFGHHCCPHPSPQQGMMGIAVLCVRLQNLYDWQPVMFCFPFSEHISAVLLSLSTKIYFILLVFLSNSGWCCLQGHSGSFGFPQHWTLTTDNRPGGVRTNLKTVRDLSRPVREGVPKLGVSMLNAIIH